MLTLIKPEREELKYRSQLLKRPHNFDFGEQPQGFSEKDWDAFMELWLNDEPKHIYRYGYCEECGFSVGAASLTATASDAYMLRILIDASVRKCGFGDALLMQMMDLAKENGANSIYLKLTPENPYISFFTKRGFAPFSDDTYCRQL